MSSISLTVEHLVDLEKYLSDQLERPLILYGVKPVIVFSEAVWKKARELGVVEFTDEELAKASKGGCIKTGLFKGFGEVQMYVDVYGVPQ
jgi:hypothetical protein